ncbi:MAG TPA: hypothetical protein VJC02_01700 [Candidatus Paceibacterota bacterium]
MQNQIENKILTVLTLLASISVIIFFSVLVRAEKTQAAMPLVFENVAIDSGSMIPLSLSVDTDVKVKDEADLNLLTNTIISEDPNISKIDVKDEEITVTYKEPAKFLGIIPTNVSVEARVNNEGKVKVYYPWYSFLTTTNKKDLEGEFNQIVSSITSTSTSSSYTPQIRAKIIAAIYSVFKSEEAEMETETEVEGNVEATTSLEN